MNEHVWEVIDEGVLIDYTKSPDWEEYLIGDTETARLLADKLNLLEAERDELRAFGQEVHSALDGKGGSYINEAPQRIADLMAERDRLRVALERIKILAPYAAQQEQA